MKHMTGIVAILALVWAGLSLGGNLIAASAKFEASGLSLQTLLRIGRAQFDWLSGAEWVIAGTIVVLLVVRASRFNLLLFLLPVVIFVGQEMLIMPALDERTLQIIAGEPVGPSNLHFGFIAAEFLKFAALIVAGIRGVLISPARS